MLPGGRHVARMTNTPVAHIAHPHGHRNCGLRRHRSRFDTRSAPNVAETQTTPSATWARHQPSCCLCQSRRSPRRPYEFVQRLVLSIPWWTRLVPADGARRGGSLRSIGARLDAPRDAAASGAPRQTVCCACLPRRSPGEVRPGCAGLRFFGGILVRTICRTWAHGRVRSVVRSSARHAATCMSVLRSVARSRASGSRHAGNAGSAPAGAHLPPPLQAVGRRRTSGW